MKQDKEKIKDTLPEGLLNEAFKDFKNNHSEIFDVLCSLNGLEKKLNNKINQGA